MVRSREPVPCGCQQPPKSTTKAGPLQDFAVEGMIAKATAAHTKRDAVTINRGSSSAKIVASSSLLDERAVSGERYMHMHMQEGGAGGRGPVSYSVKL